MGPDVAGLVVVVERDRKCTLHIAFFRNKWIHSSAPTSAQEPTDIHPWEVRRGGFGMYPYSRGMLLRCVHARHSYDGESSLDSLCRWIDCARTLSVRARKLALVYDFGVAPYAKLQKIV